MNATAKQTLETMLAEIRAKTHPDDIRAATDRLHGAARLAYSLDLIDWPTWEALDQAADAHARASH